MRFSARRCALPILLISMVFISITTRAEKAAPPSVPVPAIVNQPATVNQPDAEKLMQFRANLPEGATALDLPGYLALQKQGKVTVLDLRSPESFARRHIKGSISAPLTDLTEKTLPGLVPDKTAPVVLACDYSFTPSRMVPMTIQAYPVLHAAGYNNIYRLNLWSGPQGIAEDAQQKQIEFEGTEVKP